MTQEEIDFFLATGTPEDIVAQIKRLEPVGIAGVSTVLFSIEEDFKQMQWLSEGVMSQFASL